MRHVLCLLMVVGLFLASPAAAELLSVDQGPPDQSLSLPFQQHDARGNEWLVMPGGVLRLGNNQMYNQGACLKYLEQWQRQDNPVARRDEKTGELVLENLKLADISYTRRMKFDAASGLWRVIDIFTNPTTAPRMMGFVLQSNLGNHPVGPPMIEHPQVKRRALGWTGATRNQGWPAIVEIYNGRRSRLKASPVGYSVGNNYIWCEYFLPLPAGKSAAVMHFHGTAASVEAGRATIEAIDDGKLLNDVPPEVRKLIVNFGAGIETPGGVDLIRDDLFDVVELIGGDQLKGTLKETSYKLNTPYGVVDLPAERVLGIVGAGQFRPRQLIVAADGQVFGGELAKPTVDLELTSGQLTKVPLSQLSRLGTRKRPGESEAVPLDKPYVSLRSGERLFVKSPESPVQFITRFGTLAVDPGAIADLSFQSEQHGVHELTLTDGSRVAGFLLAEQLTFARDGGGEPMSLDAAKLLHWHFKAVEEPAGLGPALETTTGDRFAGAIDGTLKIETAFDAIDIPADQVGHLERLKDSPADVQIGLWDGAAVSGRMVEPALAMKLASGVRLKVPLSAVRTYDQPTPKPSAAVLGQIESLVRQLAADEPRDRDAAELRLMSFGGAVAPILGRLRTGQSPEAQQRIDTIVKQLTPGADPPAAPPAAEDESLAPQLQPMQEVEVLER